MAAIRLAFRLVGRVLWYWSEVVAMAQQVFSQWHPIAKALDEENNEVYIPFAGIHAQTRDGKDEVIFGAGAMVWDPDAGENGMWVPVDAANPLEVRVRELETELQQLRQLLQSGDVKVALSGRTAANDPIAARLTDGTAFVSANNPLPVLAAGRHLQPTLRLVTGTPLLAGQSYQDVAVNLLDAPGAGLVAYAVNADTITVVDVALAGTGTPGFHAGTIKISAAIFPETSGRFWFIPPFRPLGGVMRLRVTNPTGTDQSYLTVYEYRYPFTEPYPSNLRAVLAHNVEIRDTATHTVMNTPQSMYQLTRIALGGGKVPIYVNNGLNQAVKVTVELVMPGAVAAALGTVEVPAASTRVITNTDFPGIDVPSETIRVALKCDVAPTSGTVSAYIDSLVGASA